MVSLSPVLIEGASAADVGFMEPVAIICPHRQAAWQSAAQWRGRPGRGG